jgi:NAD(P)-dependent dehydrogenase (short-subunit alcohol dehydrogenase family)
MPSVLVTGAGRGIGRAIALELAADGWQVHAGVRRAADGEALRAEHPAITPVEVDVTDEAAVASLPEQLGGHLDALVNNAGIVESGPVEALPLAKLRHQLEVNVVGQVGVAQAVLPLLRESRGRIVFISSVSGRVATPLLGAYTGSKFALEAIADALRVEMRPWGIQVALVEPGSIDTDIWRRAKETADEVAASLDDEHLRLYGRQIERLKQVAGLIQGRTTAPEKVAQTVRRALRDNHPKARYVVGADAYAQLVGRALLPTRVWDALLAWSTASNP